jgi:hypothetical protein
MRVRVDLSALAGTNWKEYALRFLLGGAITVATGLIARKFGPAVGGLFLAFPAIFPASATLIATREKDEKRRAGLDGKFRGRDAAAIEARGTATGTLGLLAFALIVWRALPNHHAPAVLVAAAAAWFAVAVLFWRLRESLRIALQRNSS